MSKQILYIVARGAQGPAGAGGGDSVAGSTSISATGSPTKTLAAIFGSTAGTVCQGNDSRLSDARTPVAHSATLITSGILALARGGAGADLSATGGAGQYVKQSTSGGALTVGTIPHSDITGSTTGDPHTQYAVLSPAYLRNTFQAANNGDFAKLVLGATYADPLDVWGIYQSDDTPHLSLNWDGSALAMYLSGGFSAEGTIYSPRVEAAILSIAGNSNYLELTQNAGLKMRDLTGAHTVTQKVSSTMTTNYTVRHPTSAGTVGQIRAISAVSGGNDVQEEWVDQALGTDSGRKFAATPADGSSGAAVLRAITTADLPAIDLSDLTGLSDPTNYPGAVRKAPTSTGDNQIYSTTDVQRLILKLMTGQTAWQVELEDDAGTVQSGIDEINLFRGKTDTASDGTIGYGFTGLDAFTGFGYNVAAGALVAQSGIAAGTYFYGDGTVGLSGLLDAAGGILCGGDTEIQSGSLNITTLGRGISIKMGTNGMCGNSTLVGGTVTVSNTNVTSGCQIFLTVRSLGTVTVPKAVGVTARVNGTSFTITSADATDTSVVSWMIVKSN